MSVSDLALALIVLLAYTTQAISGFGSTVITITLAALWLPISDMLPISLLLNVPFSGWLLWQERAHTQWRLLAHEIMPLMIVGAVIGAALVPLLAASAVMKQLYGLLIIGLSLLDLWRLRRQHLHRFAMSTRLAVAFGSGFTQGLYGSGGPLLAAAMAGSGLSKAASRATMIAVWFSVNTGLTLWLFLGGHYTRQLQLTSAWLFPLTIFGLVIGNHLHRRIDERQFRLLIDLLLLFAGLGLLR